MTKDEVLTKLVTNTHSLFTSSFVDKVNEAFRVNLKPMTYHDTSATDPKGLSLDGGETEAVGLAAFDLAPMLCNKLGVEYPSMLGRGFQVRACVDAIRKAGIV